MELEIHFGLDLHNFSHGRSQDCVSRVYPKNSHQQGTSFILVLLNFFISNDKKLCTNKKQFRGSKVKGIAIIFFFLIK